MDHLNSKHMEAMIELDAAKKQSQAKLTDFKFMKTSNQEKYKASNPKQKQRDMNFLRFATLIAEHYDHIPVLVWMNLAAAGHSRAPRIEVKTIIDD